MDLIEWAVPVAFALGLALGLGLGLADRRCRGHLTWDDYKAAHPDRVPPLPLGYSVMTRVPPQGGSGTAPPKFARPPRDQSPWVPPKAIPVERAGRTAFVVGRSIHPAAVYGEHV